MLYVLCPSCRKLTPPKHHAAATFAELVWDGDEFQVARRCIHCDVRYDAPLRYLDPAVAAAVKARLDYEKTLPPERRHL